LAHWITHARLADRILAKHTSLDTKGFAVGSIMPDCNVENADWSAFDPPRETTHYMRGDKKTSVDEAAFYADYIAGKRFSCEEERSFFLGYMAHLIADRLFMLFIRDPSRVAACFARLHADRDSARLIDGAEEDLDSLKRIYGKQEVFADIVYLEQEYIRTHPDSCYMTVIRPLSSFPDYMPMFPAGAAVRKRSVMVPEHEPVLSTPRFLLFTKDEYAAYLDKAEAAIELYI